jgi:tetratricopeptide (TPR) repeat protein
MNFDAWRHYLRARVFRLLRQPEVELAAYREALKVEPRFALAAHGLAYLLAARGHTGEAETLFRKVVALTPRDATAWFNLGFLCERSHNTAEAIDAFRQAVALNPKFDRAWYGLGLGTAALGQHDQAAEAFEQAVKLDPMNGHAWYQLGMAYHHARSPDKVRGIIEHLNRFERHHARRLMLDAERADLAHLFADLNKS